MNKIKYKNNTSSLKAIREHLNECSNSFVPSLDTYVDIDDYSEKIYQKAVKFEAYIDKDLIGLIALYINLDIKTTFITNISVLPDYQGSKITKILFANCLEYVISNNFDKITLEVKSDNIRACKFYKKNGFQITNNSKEIYKMELILKRDYNKESKDTADHNYAYDFDFDVMHPFMIRSFEPYFIKGNMLELGSYKGDFTKRFIPYFDDITCVEAADEAIKEAKKNLGDKVKLINSLFENATLPVKYDNIVLTHVLEHLDDPVLVLKRINDEWLTDSGRFFLVCPNANAPSRQIAVKMGLISHNSAVTSAEKEHGHKITYTLDTLERDAKIAGLRVVHRSGIFFKALANFQWDQLLQTDIISEDYLEGCYQLGHQYPDLCSSIFLLCEKGK